MLADGPPGLEPPSRADTPELALPGAASQKAGSGYGSLGGPGQKTGYGSLTLHGYGGYCGAAAAGIVDVLDMQHAESGRKAQIIVCADPLVSALAVLLGGAGCTAAAAALLSRRPPTQPAGPPCLPQGAPARFDLSAAATWWDGRQLATLYPETTDK